MRRSKVTVNVPEDTPASIVSLSVTENGTYYASDHSADGFDPVNVNVDDEYDKGYADGSADLEDTENQLTDSNALYDYPLEQGDENADNVGVMSPFTSFMFFG